MGQFFVRLLSLFLSLIQHWVQSCVVLFSLQRTNQTRKEKQVSPAQRPDDDDQKEPQQRCRVQSAASVVVVVLVFV